MNSSIVTTPSRFRSIFWETTMFSEFQKQPRFLTWSWTNWYLEEILHVFKCSIFFHRRISVTAHHIIDGPHDRQHFLWKVTVRWWQSQTHACIKESMTSRLTHTSLVMYPSLLMSYRLKAHLSFSVTEPRSRTERPITKSCQNTRILSSRG